MIFTSYYANMKNLPENFVPVAISRGVPKWFKGGTLLDLAPSWDILMEYKQHPEWGEKKAEERYISRYQGEVLAKHTPLQISGKIASIIAKNFPDKKKDFVWSREDVHVVLLCYEKPGDFCHRNLVSQWLLEHKISCQEVTPEVILRYGTTRPEKEEEADYARE